MVEPLTPPLTVRKTCLVRLVWGRLVKPPKVTTAICEKNQKTDEKTLPAPQSGRISASAAPTIGTNRIDISATYDPRTHNFILTSAEDSLMKGASGQAVQSMNIRCGFPETAGLT